MIAAGLIVALQQVALRQIEGLHILQEYQKLGFLLLGVIILGALIGIASTFQALARYLRMALDDLY